MDTLPIHLFFQQLVTVTCYFANSVTQKCKPRNSCSSSAVSLVNLRTLGKHISEPLSSSSDNLVTKALNPIILFQ